MTRATAWVLATILSLALFGVARAESDYPIQPVPFTQVEVGPGFWLPRMETNRKVTVPYCFHRCEETGRISNFVAAAERNADGFEGIYFNDSDVFKIVEGASYTLAMRADPDLDAYLDQLIAKFGAAQEEDGYLYTAKTSGSKGRFGQSPRWTGLDHSHELYNVGHMYEAAVAHFQATGKRSLLDMAIQNADLVAKVFGPGPGQLTHVPGHEEIEIGLVRLYRVTGDEKYLDLARFFVDMRGQEEKRESLYGRYAQDHAPVREQSEAVGHAVRGGYFYAGVADVAALTGERAYIDAIDRIWQDVIDRKLYLTGSVGQHGAGEGYAGAYQLTNIKAYNETCASIALALWNQRMFLLHGDGKYVDLLERIIYNGFLSGVSLSGDRFFYPNPLECDMKFRFNHGDFERSPWFNCSCCPSNVVRFIPSIPGYVYAVRDRDIYVNLFLAGRATIDVDGASVQLVQQTDYPWNGKIRIDVQPAQETEFTLRVRIPAWVRGEVLPSDLYRYADPTAADWSVMVNGRGVPPTLDAGYAVLHRRWKPGDVVDIDLEMPVRRVLANEQIEYDRGRVAIERGPLVYCLEGADHDGHALDIWLPDDAGLSPEHRPELLGGVTVLRGEGRAVYRAEDKTIQSRPRPITMIPYYAWCHRGGNEMAVWPPRSPGLVKAPLAPTIASASRPSASHQWRSDDALAMNDQIEPKHSNDHEIPRFTWWDHCGTAEWVQYEFAKPTKVTGVEVYWFDDTGRGRCRVPQSWKLLYRDGERWKLVKAMTEGGVSKDQYNQVAFEAVKTDALRIEVQLQPAFSGGILEWRVTAR
ncbi:MAG: beta-L-arabinofuranosidase domain-containing protein [Pirellulaceae bacterium]